jgi:2-(1,2-epoxy-1,2-dihydrophenyl)acetyl-CoA isomerase
MTDGDRGLDEQTVVCVTDGPVAMVTLDRPAHRNAITTEMVEMLHDILGQLASNDDIRIVVLTGSGSDFFCPGADLGGRAGAARRPEVWRLRIPVLLHDMPQVTIAAINGACAGAGLGWAGACDLRVASASARFNTAFLDVGVAGDMGLPWSLMAAVGATRARELFFLRGKFSAEEALRWGLVSAVYPKESFRQEVATVVERLRSASPTALRFMKANFVAAERMGFGDYVDLESERHLRIVAGPDFAEGIRAFQEGRKPSFG